MKWTRRLLSLLLSAVFILSFFAPAGAWAAATPKDIQGHWAQSYIAKAIERGYINGYKDGTFRPNAAITRAEFCKMINSALGITQSESVSFSDVSSKAWYRAEVGRALAAGYISGYTDNTFRADNNISRQEAALVLSRIVTPPSQLKDMGGLNDQHSVDAWALDGVKTVYTKGYMTGDKKQNFNPMGNLTRGEAVKTVEAILGSENIVKSDLRVSTGGTYNDTLYVGNVHVSADVGANDTVTLTNCRVLGSTTLSGGKSLILNHTGLTSLVVDNSSNKVEVRSSGYSRIGSSLLTQGASLVESGLSGEGFLNVSLSGSKLSGTEVNLNGNFETVRMENRGKLKLASGSIAKLYVETGATGSRIDLSSGSHVKWMEANASCDFVGKGRIYEAVLNSRSVTFETQPDAVLGQGSLVPTVSPRDGSTNVSVNSNITLEFDEAVYAADGKTLSGSKIRSDVIELRSGSENGTTVPFTASIASSNRLITIRPDSDLKKDTTYYIVLLGNSLRNNGKVYNTRQVFKFSTVGLMVPVTYPVDGSENLPVGTQVSIRFSEPITRGDTYAAVDANYLKEVLSFRQGSSNGPEVEYTPKIEGDKRTIVLAPKESLTLGTRYYVQLRAGAIANESKNLNSLISFTFQTAGSSVLVPVLDPPSGTRGLSPTPMIKLSFDTPLFTGDGSTAITTDYLENEAFSLRRGSSTGTKESFLASIDSTRKVITIESDGELRENTDYYLVLERNAFGDASASNRKTNAKMVFSFTTGKANEMQSLVTSVSPSNDKSDVPINSKIVVRFNGELKTADNAALSPAYLQSSVIELRRGGSSGTLVSEYTVAMSTGKDQAILTLKTGTNLEKNTRYYVVVRANTLQNNDGVKNSRFTSSFVTGSQLALTASMSPANGSTDANTNTNIELRFNETLYQKDGVLQLRNNEESRTYVKNNVIKLMENGQAITFDVNVESTRITILPTKALSVGKTYTVTITKDSLSTFDGVKNDLQTYSFAVGSGLKLDLSPADGSTGVDRNTGIYLRFDDSLTIPNPDNAGNGSVVLDLNNSKHVDYVKQVVTFDGGNVRLSTSNAGKTLVLTPETKLQGNKKYTVTVAAGAFMGARGGTNLSSKASFTTTDILDVGCTPRDGSTEVAHNSKITLSFDDVMQSNITGISDVQAAVAAAVEITYPGGTVPYTISPNTSGDKSFTISPEEALKPNTTYTVTLKAGLLKNSDGLTNPARSFRFTTAPAPSSDKSLKADSLKVDGVSATLASGTSYTVSALPDTEITVTAAANDTKAMVAMSGAGLDSSTGKLTTPASGTVEITITVTAEDGTKQDYILTITIIAGTP